MEIKEVTRITELVKKVNCQNYALIAEVAKESGVKKTALMQFIVDNPKLFKLVEQKKGLAIKVVYADAAQNPETEEWLEVQKKAWEKKIHIGELTYYGCHEYWIVPVERETKEAQYRNTPEKIKYLVDNGVIAQQRVCTGGWGDASYNEVYLYTKEVQEKLEALGWTTDFDKEKTGLD